MEKGKTSSHYALLIHGVGYALTPTPCALFGMANHD